MKPTLTGPHRDHSVKMLKLQLSRHLKRDGHPRERGQPREEGHISPNEIGENIRRKSSFYSPRVLRERFVGEDKAIRNQARLLSDKKHNYRIKENTWME